MPHTQFSRVHVVQVLEPSSGQDRWIVVLASLESHSISSMFHCTLLHPQLSPHFSTPFPTLAPGSSAFPSLFYPSASPSTAAWQGGLCFGRLAEQSHLTPREANARTRHNVSFLTTASSCLSSALCCASLLLTVFCVARTEALANSGLHCWFHCFFVPCAQRLCATVASHIASTRRFQAAWAAYAISACQWL